MKTLLIIPTYNEAENLSPLLQEIFSAEREVPEATREWRELGHA